MCHSETCTEKTGQGPGHRGPQPSLPIAGGRPGPNATATNVAETRPKSQRNRTVQPFQGWETSAHVPLRTLTTRRALDRGDKVAVGFAPQRADDPLEDSCPTRVSTRGRGVRTSSSLAG
jgi:hypothetical protein